MTMSMPQWRPFDVSAPRVLSMLGPGEGRVVLFAMTPEFLAGPHGVRLAIGVSRTWTALGEQVVLVDGCFANPQLDQEFHLPNDEGLADVLFVGASLRDVAQPGGRIRFDVVTAGSVFGTMVPRVGHERWTRVSAEVQSTGVTLALLAPPNSELFRRALKTCTDIIVLGQAPADLESILPASEDRIREFLGPAPRGPRLHPSRGTFPGSAATAHGQPVQAPRAPLRSPQIATSGSAAAKMRPDHVFLFSAENLPPLEPEVVPEPPPEARVEPHEATLQAETGPPELGASVEAETWELPQFDTAAPPLDVVGPPEAREEPSVEVREEPSVEVREEPTFEADDEPSVEVREEPTFEADDEPSVEVREEPTFEAHDEPPVERKFDQPFATEPWSPLPQGMPEPREAPLQAGFEAPVSPPRPEQDDRPRTDWRPTDTHTDLWHSAAAEVRRAGSFSPGGARLPEHAQRVPLQPGVVLPSDFQRPPRRGRRDGRSEKKLTTSWLGLVGATAIVTAGVMALIPEDFSLRGLMSPVESVSPASNDAPTVIPATAASEVVPSDSQSEAVSESAQPPAAATAVPSSAPAVVPISTPEAGVGPGATGVASPPTLTSPETAPLQGFSYSLGAFTASTVASDYVAALSTRAPNELFVIAPVSVSGTIYYRVLGGTASNSPELERVRPRLAAAISEDGSEWLERETQLAFTLGNHTSLGAAVAQAGGSLLAAAHPYVLRIDHEDGSMTYRVYAGGYASSRESSVLREFLSDSGIAGELTERRGVVVR